MGASGSSQISGASSGHQMGSNPGEGLRGAPSWSSLHEGDQGLGGHPSSPFCSQGSGKGSGAGGEKKKRNLASLATLRKRLVRRARRVSKSFDHSQVLKEFLVGWSTRDVLQLVEEYEATGLLKELHVHAEIARPSASTVAHDLNELYDCKYVADTFLVFRGVHFPVHKAIVCVRSPLFRELLGKINTFAARVPVSLDIPGLRPELFNDLLRYLYSGELTPTTSPNGSTPSPSPSVPSYDSVLLRLSEQFGVPNDLDHDLRRLLETGLYSDASLVFSPPPSACDYGPPSSYSVPVTPLKKCRACSDQAEYSCHSAILAARSPFFRNVIQRHQRRFTDPSNGSETRSNINTANQKIRIVLDESIIPRRFARVILHSMYRDSQDLVTVLPLCVCKCYLHLPDQSPANQSAPNGSGSTTSIGSSVATSCSLASGASSASSASSSTSSPSCYVKEVMDLYEMARFLELDSLIQSCEDMIIDSISLDTVVFILRWSEQPHGSPWVKRQALCFLREEYSSVASSPILYHLSMPHLLEAVKSDYLQASELEVLSSVIKWGENRLVKRMEEREPNIVSQTAHSLRRGLRKRELNDAELRDIISELMANVRIGHILPLDCETLTNAAKRGLISTLPPYMLGEDSGMPYVRGISCWLRGRGSGPFVKPRHFNAYVEEAKSYLEERLGRPGEMIPNPRISRGISHIPDTLYMVGKEPSTGALAGDHFPSLSADHHYNCCSGSVSACYEEISEVALAMDGGSTASISQLPVIEQRILVLMKQREQELKSVAFSHRALALVPNGCEILKSIQLRVVREFGLPDAASEILHGSNYIPYPATETTDTGTDDMTASYGEAGMVPSSGVLSNLGSNGALASDKDYAYSLQGMRMENSSPLPAPAPANESYLTHYSFESEYLGSSHHGLSDLMPDIAMATSALAEMHLFKRSTESLARQPPPPQRPGTATNFYLP